MLNLFPHIPDGGSRYFIARDWHCEDRRVYGILKLDTSSVLNDIKIKFYNDISYITLVAHEISGTEWETMREFDLFPVLHPFNIHDILSTRITGNMNSPKQTTVREIITEYEVRFRDY